MGSSRLINLNQRLINSNRCWSKYTDDRGLSTDELNLNQHNSHEQSWSMLSKDPEEEWVRTGLLAGSIVLSNVDERLSNIDESKMFTVKVMGGKFQFFCLCFPAMSFTWLRSPHSNIHHHSFVTWTLLVIYAVSVCRYNYQTEHDDYHCITSHSCTCRFQFYSDFIF